MYNINLLLNQREKDQRPINVAVIGAGWYGRGLIQELCRWPGMTPKVIISKNTANILSALNSGGVDKSLLTVVKTAAELHGAFDKCQYIATDNYSLVNDLKGIDVIFEATGDILVSTEIALAALEQGIHFVTVNSEMDSTLGYQINKLFEAKNLIFSNSDGDQPGVIARMIEKITSMGFKIVVAGSCKGFIDPHKNPVDIAPWVRKGHNPKMITSFTDGTKQSMELAVVANAAGLFPDKRAMHGPRVTKPTLTETFAKLIKNPGAVDYVLGIDGVDQGAGVFVVCKREGGPVTADLQYLKKGDGPHYLFFRDDHLCYLEAPVSIAEAGVLNVASMAPKAFNADVIACAKKDLKKGERIDGIGGFMAYGVIDRAEITREENLLPMGLSEYAVLKRNVERDTPLSYDMVEFPEDNTAIELRRKMEQEYNEKERLTADKR